jgi:hypothetical protein
MLVCFLAFYQLMGKHLDLLMDVVSGFKSFSEARGLSGLCNPQRRGRGEPAKPRLLYPLVLIPCCYTVSEKPGS